MRRISLLLMLGVMLVLAGTAVATDYHFRGEYAFTGTGFCLISTLGFNADFTPVAGSTTSGYDMSSRGVAIFYSNGTGTAHGTLVRILFGSLNWAESHEFSFQFSYSVGHDGTITMVPVNYTATILTGPGAGTIVTSPTLSLDSGMASQEDHETITLATKTPAVETLTLSTGPIVYEICARSSVSIRMHH